MTRLDQLVNSLSPGARQFLVQGLLSSGNFPESLLWMIPDRGHPNAMQQRPIGHPIGIRPATRNAFMLDGPGAKVGVNTRPVMNIRPNVAARNAPAVLPGAASRPPPKPVSLSSLAGLVDSRVQPVHWREGNR